MLKWLFNKKPIKIVLSTDLFYTAQKEFISMCDSVDPTFSSRYLDTDNPGRLHGETFWDQDKYNIFYLDIPKEKIPSFVQAAASHKDCLFIGKIDENYDLKQAQKPFYISDRATDYRGKFALPYARRRDTRYPLRTSTPTPKD